MARVHFAPLPERELVYLDGNLVKFEEFTPVIRKQLLGWYYIDYKEKKNQVIAVHLFNTFGKPIGIFSMHPGKAAIFTRQLEEIMQDLEEVEI